MVPLTPYEVSRGADTKIVVKVGSSGQIVPMQKGPWHWNDALSIRSLKTGKPVHEEIEWLDDERVLLGGGGGGSSSTGRIGGGLYYNSTSLLRLRDVSADLGALQANWDWVFGPQLATSQKQALSRPGRTRQTKKMPGALSTRATLQVRSAGETIGKPVVSTDPLFDVRSVKVTPSKSALRSGPVTVIVDIFYRGALKDNVHQPVEYEGRWDLIASGKDTYRGSDAGGFLEITGVRKLGQLTESFDVSSMSAELKKQPLILRGTISIDGAWPRIVEIPIP